jgi:hypothetical protein
MFACQEMFAICSIDQFYHSIGAKFTLSIARIFGEFYRALIDKIDHSLEDGRGYREHRARLKLPTL